MNVMRLGVWKLTPDATGDLFWEAAGDMKQIMGGGNSKMFYFHPDPWRHDLIWLIFFKWVETTNQNIMAEALEAETQEVMEDWWYNIV